MADAPPQIPPAFTNLQDWMTHWLARTIDYRIGDAASPGACWCEQWWDHPQATVRLLGVWRAWEAARPSGQMDAWWRNAFEPAWRTLTDSNGPFRDCHPARDGRAAKHRPPERPSLPMQPMPAHIAASLPGLPAPPTAPAPTATTADKKSTVESLVE